MRQGGFTMVEILISLTILSIILLGIAGMVATGYHEFGTAEKTLLAVQAAKDRMERLRDAEGDSSGEETSQRGIVYAWDTRLNVPEAGLSTLTVTASWTDLGKEFSVRLIRLRHL
jgi:prepilin-type N-terminal cleavage/methylation domain-containing protein